MRIAVVALLVAVSGLEAQLPSSVRLGDRFVTLSQASSFASDAGPRLSYIRDRHVVLTALRLERVWLVSRSVAVSSVMEFPLAVLGRPRSETCSLRQAGGDDECVRAFQSPNGAIGIGAAPLGVQVVLGPALPVRVTGSVSGGLIYFDRKTPSQYARALNFSGDYTLGVDVPVGASVLSVSWKFQHWSNAGTARSNPGIDANLLVVGLKQRRK